ncbi:DUF362 domain-containing protein [candidate division KSB1 bacterium]|nr:DUF362 domain-containing protein [candidate division KSB1 bacterium]
MLGKITPLKSLCFNICQKTGKIKSLKSPKGITKLLFPVIGLFSLIWFLIRVLPKPSRAAYPCMRVAVPVASGFIVYMLGLITSIFAFHKAKKRLRESRYILASVFIVIGLVGSLILTEDPKNPVYANFVSDENPPNTPIGTPKGIFPGRVVWAHNPDATNEKCTLDYRKDDGWFMPNNNDPAIIEKMVSDVLQSLTGTTSDKEAWKEIFKFYNKNHEKGEVTYKTGEKIFIKINATSAWSGNFNTSDLSKADGKNYSIAETNPYVVLAVFKQLVNVVGVPENMIYVGDPLKHIYKYMYELWHSEFPNIHYLDYSYNNLGREKVVKSSKPVIFYADKGEVLNTGSWNDPFGGEPVYEDFLYTIFQDMEYMLNIPTLKGHKRAGVTMFAKNHFGSHCRNDASHLHNGLVNPTEQDPFRQGYGLYRVLVDIMGHELLGGKNLVYIMDAIYAGSEATDPPTRWTTSPFNNDWTSSIFASLDPVAIESVGYDFLKAEYTEDKPWSYPQMVGVDDYLHQAADKANWPKGIVYDPENDGTPINSLGVHEHWNNDKDKQYTRNLGTGEGIELVKIGGTTAVEENEMSGAVKSYQLYANYPNPFNPQTTIRFDIQAPAHVELTVYNTIGQQVSSLVNADYTAGSFTATWDGAYQNGKSAASGIYIYHLRVTGDDVLFQESREMLLLR